MLAHPSPQRAQASYVYELENLSFGYHKTTPTLRDLSFRIQAGEKLAILGANGAGKTTLLRLLAGQLAPSSGLLRVFGSAVHADTSRTAVGLGRQVALVTSRFDTTLSEGQKKRVSLSAALAMLPPVILLDEPMNGLDGPGRQWCLGALRELKGSDKTVIVGTHDLVVAELAADRLLVLSEDHTLGGDGPPERLLKQTTLLVNAGLLHEHVHTHGGTTHSHYHPSLSSLSQTDNGHHGEEHSRERAG